MLAHIGRFLGVIFCIVAFVALNVVYAYFLDRVFGGEWGPGVFIATYVTIALLFMIWEMTE